MLHDNLFSLRLYFAVVRFIILSCSSFSSLTFAHLFFYSWVIFILCASLFSKLSRSWFDPVHEFANDCPPYYMTAVAVSPFFLYHSLAFAALTEFSTCLDGLNLEQNPPFTQMHQVIRQFLNIIDGRQSRVQQADDFLPGFENFPYRYHENSGSDIGWWRTR